MSVLDRKLRRELLASKGVLAAIVAIIAVGICCFVGMTSLYFNLEGSRKDYYSQCRMADFSVSVKKLPLSRLSLVTELPGVAEIAPRIQFPVTADIEQAEKPIAGLVISLPDERRPVINNILLRSGDYFSDDGNAEVIINDAFARAHDLKAGDSLHLLLNNRRQRFTIIGTAISSEFVYIVSPGSFVPDPETYGIFYVKQSLAEDLFDFEGASNQLVGLLSPGIQETPGRLLDEIERRLDEFGVSATTARKDQPSHLFLTSEIDGLRINATILPAIFLGVAAMILNVLMIRIAEQQRTTVGTLKALGYSDRQLFAHFIKFGLVIGFIGGGLGAIGGYLMAGAITQVYVQYYEFPRLVNRVDPRILAAGMGVSLLFAVAGTLRAIRRILKLAPAEAMRPKPPPPGRGIALEHLGFLWSRLGFRWQIVLRGMFRQKMRTTVGILATSAGASLLLVTFYMKDSVYEMIEFQFRNVLLSDFDLSFADERDYGVVYETKRLPGVEYAEPRFEVACTFRHGGREKQGAITGLISSAQLTIPRQADGRRIEIPEAGLVLTRRLAELLDVRAGQALTIEPVDGARRAFLMPVARIVDSYMGTAAYADFEFLNQKVGESRTVTSMQLTLTPGPAAESGFYRAVKRLPVIQSVTPVRGNADKLEQLVADQMWISISVIMVFAGLIFFGSVLNASLISLAERKQEVATLRVIGYSPSEVGAIFLRESLLINVLGSLLGLVIGYWLSLQIGKLWNTDLFRMPFVLHWHSWIWPVLAGVVFTLLAHVPVQRAIHRLEIANSLNVKE